MLTPWSAVAGYYRLLTENSVKCVYERQQFDIDRFPVMEIHENNFVKHKTRPAAQCGPHASSCSQQTIHIRVMLPSGTPKNWDKYVAGALTVSHEVIVT